MPTLSTYLIVPSFDFQPATGSIQLGSIIADPLRPHRILTSVDQDGLSRYPPIEVTTDYKFGMVHDNQGVVSGSLWTKFVTNVGAGISGESSTQTSNEYDIDSLVTEYFISDPSDSELEARIGAEKIRRFMRAGLPFFSKPVYMVNGIKIAKGLRASHGSGKRVAGNVDVGAAVPTPIGDVAIGASAGSSQSSGNWRRWTAGEDRVFAYQLLKIELKGWKRSAAADEYRPKTAFLSLDEGSQQVSNATEFGTGHLIASVPTIDELVASDESGASQILEIGNGYVDSRAILVPDLD